MISFNSPCTHNNTIITYTPYMTCSSIGILDIDSSTYKHSVTIETTAADFGTSGYIYCYWAG